jgi:hypothetical protein
VAASASATSAATASAIKRSRKGTTGAFRRTFPRIPAILTAINADTCERLHVLVPYDADCARRYSENAQRIIDATRRGELLDRFTDNPNHYRCKMCGHRVRCWR